MYILKLDSKSRNEFSILNVTPSGVPLNLPVSKANIMFLSVKCTKGSLPVVYVTFHIGFYRITALCEIIGV